MYDNNIQLHLKLLRVGLSKAKSFVSKVSFMRIWFFVYSFLVYSFIPIKLVFFRIKCVYSHHIRLFVSYYQVCLIVYSYQIRLFVSFFIGIKCFVYAYQNVRLFVPVALLEVILTVSRKKAIRKGNASTVLCVCVFKWRSRFLESIKDKVCQVEKARKAYRMARPLTM